MAPQGGGHPEPGQRLRIEQGDETLLGFVALDLAVNALHRRRSWRPKRGVGVLADQSCLLAGTCPPEPGSLPCPRAARICHF